MVKFGREDIENLTKVIESGKLGDHPRGFMDQFKADFCAVTGSKHTILAATAMLLMQAIPGAIGAGAGDEIICDALVHFHALACLHNNIVPVWADLRTDNYLMDPDDAERRITKRTKAIWVTHMFGYAAEVDRLREICDKHGIYLLEDCAHSILGNYKGRKVGTWGHIGTFSFNNDKQLSTGEGGAAITDDDKLAAELNKRIIFGSTPEVLSSNYRMTELQAAVGVAQLKKVQGYIDEYREGCTYLENAIKDCTWLDARYMLPDSDVIPYSWSCFFYGERSGVSYDVFKAALKQSGARFGTGYLQVPPYQYAYLREPFAYGNKGCPYKCNYYDGAVEWEKGLCPNAEAILPRIVHINAMCDKEISAQNAEALRKAIALAEKGDVEPLTYSDLENKILSLVKEFGPIEPIETVGLYQDKGWGGITEAVLWNIMEDLLYRFPYKLSKAGPRKYAYQDLS